MTLSQFEKLPAEEQVRFLKESGNFLMVREGFRYSVSLYAAADFFAEVWYNMQQDRVIDVKAFKESWRLDSYLDELNLNDLL